MKDNLVVISSFYRTLWKVSLGAAAIASFCLLMPAKVVVLFWPLYFLFPILWVLWIGCAFFVVIEQRVFRLIKLWLLIDGAILLYFVAVAINSTVGFRSQGADMVVLLTYSPIVVPTVFLVAKLPDSVVLSVSHLFEAVGRGGSSIGDAISTWLTLSVIGALQSSLIILFPVIWRTRKLDSP